MAQKLIKKINCTVCCLHFTLLGSVQICTNFHAWAFYLISLCNTKVHWAHVKNYIQVARVLPITLPATVLPKKCQPVPTTGPINVLKEFRSEPQISATVPLYIVPATNVCLHSVSHIDSLPLKGLSGLLE